MSRASRPPTASPPPARAPASRAAGAPRSARRSAREPGGHARRRGHGHRQHLRQVRLHQPGGQAADGGLRAHARRAVREGRAAIGARRRLRRGRAHSQVGGAGRAGARGRDRPRGPRDPGRVGAAAGAEPRVPDHEGREAPVRRPRVRRRGRDRGARARARPRAHGRRDGAGRERAPAGLRAARAALARAQHGPRRLPEGPRQHPRPPEPLVQARLRGAAVAARRGRGGALAVPVDHAARASLSTATRSYGRGARILSVGIATTGLVTFAYFSLASHALSEVDYKGISLLWSVMFLIISIIYRPVEQLLSRTISARRARGLEGGHPLRTAIGIQAVFAALFLVVALAGRTRIQDDVFDGSAELYWVLVVGVLAYAVSHFARGWLAGHSRFVLYGGLVLLESCSRCLFALAVVLGVASGQGAVALGIAAAPLVSLMVVPWALRGRDPAPPSEAAAGAGLGSNTRFAAAVLVIMAAEQALLNGPVVAADATSTDA